MINRNYFTSKEYLVIKTFYGNLSRVGNDAVLELRWNNGSIFAKYETDYGDEDDVTNEFSQYFVFSFVSQIGDNPLHLKLNAGDLFEINYKNFPEFILLNNEKIN